MVDVTFLPYVNYNSAKLIACPPRKQLIDAYAPDALNRQISTRITYLAVSFAYKYQGIG